MGNLKHRNLQGQEVCSQVDCFASAQEEEEEGGGREGEEGEKGG